MKLSELKHNHSLTDLLKVCLFSTLMLAPFISVAVRSLYVIFNKNAYQSYSGTETQQIATPTYNTNKLDDYTDFVVGNYYVLEWTYNYSQNSVTETIIEDTGYNNFRYISYWSDNMTSYTINNEDKTMDFIIIQIENNSHQVLAYDSTDDIGSSIDNRGSGYITNQVLLQCLDTTNLNTIHQDFTYWFNDDLSNFQNYDIETIESATLDNVFNYSVEKLANDSLFNWTQQTAVFSGIQTMTNNLGINYPAIPVILAYWFLLTIIYVIIDIIIKSFTLLTHIIGSKKA